MFSYHVSELYSKSKTAILLIIQYVNSYHDIEITVVFFSKRRYDNILVESIYMYIYISKILHLILLHIPIIPHLLSSAILVW